MSYVSSDPVAAFYDRHPYPPPVARLGAAARPGGGATALTDHHLIWPDRPYGSIGSILVAGCGTSQAVRHALNRPSARVVGIDVSAASLEHSRALAARHDVSNLTVHRLAIEDVAELGERFDHVVCTGVLHHLRDPPSGLRALRAVLAPGGAMTVMVYARYGRAGVSMLQDYCRRLRIGASAPELADLVATLRELPLAHPFGRLLRDTRDFADDGALADALCNPRDRAYTVSELFELVAGAGLRFGRWVRQAPYLPDCGSISETPHAERIAALAPPEQYAVMELYRGTITRHSAILFAVDDATTAVLGFGASGVERWIPIRIPSALAVEERLPPHAAAALINRAHTDSDLVLFADRRHTEVFRSIDGRRTIGELGPDATPFIERLWRHDLVALDTSAADRRPAPS